jgi:hypothetical protein
MSKRGHRLNTQLEPIEKLKAAYFYDVRGVDQQTIADMFGVNIARVNEAIHVVREAVGASPRVSNSQFLLIEGDEHGSSQKQ